MITQILAQYNEQVPLLRGSQVYPRRRFECVARLASSVASHQTRLLLSSFTTVYWFGSVRAILADEDYDGSDRCSL